MITITKIGLNEEKDGIVKVIRSSFATVAEELKLTKENSPTNPAFISYDSISESLNKGLNLYGMFSGDKIIGCIGIEDSGNDNIFYIERLAVIPEYRHKNYGTELLNYAFSEIRKQNGKTVSIGIINENSVLKNWYAEYGFIETGLKKFDHLPFTVCFMQMKV